MAEKNKFFIRNNSYICLYMALLRTLFTLFILSVGFVNAQYIPTNIDRTLHLFLIEMESNHLIEHYNQSAYTYSQKQIYGLLQEAELNGRYQNARQKQQIGYYLRQFQSSNAYNRWEEHDVDILRSGNLFSLSLNPPGMFIRSDYSGISVTPLIGALATITDADKTLNRHWGARISGNANAFGYYFSFKQQYNSAYTYQNYVNEILPADGFYYRNKQDIKFGISFANKALTTALTFDNQTLLPQAEHIFNLSTSTPSYPAFMLSLAPLSWLTYQFRTGYISNANNNAEFSSYLESHETNHYFAHNQLIINPVKHVELTLGQTAFITQNKPKGSYLLPVNLYVSGEPNENTLFYYRIKVAALKHLNLSFSQSFDDFTLDRAQSEYDKNVQAYTFNATLSGWPLQNIQLNYFNSVQYPLFMNHKQSPLFNLWNQTQLPIQDNRHIQGIEFVAKPLYNLSINIGYQFEQLGESLDYTRAFPYDFSVLKNIERKTDIISFEFIVKPAYNTTFFAGIHYINHRGKTPSYKVENYNNEVKYIFRMGFNIGL